MSEPATIELSLAGIAELPAAEPPNLFATEPSWNHDESPPYPPDGVFWGDLHCRRCGSILFLARVAERTARTKHLKCSECGKRHRVLEPRALR
jgi:hypothetical protein